MQQNPSPRPTLILLASTGALIALLVLTEPAGMPSADASFSGEADTEVDYPQYTGDNRQWIVSLAGMAIVTIAAPVLIQQFKASADRSGKNLSYAWEAARLTQEQLITSKNETIERLIKELEQAREAIAVLDERNDQLHERMLRAELQLVETIKRLEQIAPTVDIHVAAIQPSPIEQAEE